MSQVRIRAFRQEYFHAVTRLMTELQTYLAETDILRERMVFQSKQEAESYVNQALQDVAEMDGRLFVAEDNNGRVVGFIQGVIVKPTDGGLHALSYRPRTEGWIGLLFVEPEMRGRGIGKQLISAMREHFTAEGCDSMRLKVDSQNHPAIAVYLKYGFVPRELEMAMTIQA